MEYTPQPQLIAGQASIKVESLAKDPSLTPQSTKAHGTCIVSIVEQIDSSAGPNVIYRVSNEPAGGLSHYTTYFGEAITNEVDDDEEVSAKVKDPLKAHRLGRRIVGQENTKHRPARARWSALMGAVFH